MLVSSLNFTVHLTGPCRTQRLSVTSRLERLDLESELDSRLRWRSGFLMENAGEEHEDEI